MADRITNLGPFGFILGKAHHYAYLIAAIIMGSICLVTTIITFILAKTHNDLKQRGRYLVFWNGLSATGIVTVYLMLNSFVGSFPCFVLLWNAMMAYTKDPAPVVAFSGNELNNKSSLGHGPSSSRISGGLAVTGSQSAIDAPLQGAVEPAQECSQQTSSGAHRGGIPTIVTPKDLDGPPLSTLPCPVQGPSIHNITVTPPQSASSTPTSARLGDTNYHTDSSNKNNYGIRTISSPPGIGIFPDSNGVVLSNSNIANHGSTREIISNPHDIGQMVQRTQTITFDSVQTERKRRWSRYLPFNKATDSRLAVFLMGCMIVPFVLCLGMQFVKPSPVQINPISYKCGEGLVFYPIYAVMLGFLAIGCPFLSWKLWWIKDGFGIRNELLMNMIIGLPGFILYFISPFYFKKLDAGHWNHVNWLILTIFFSHVNSVVLPLIQFFMRQRPKKRASSTKGSTGNPFASILRWDSPKKSSGAAAMDACSETSSFRGSSQIASPHHGTDLYDSSVYDGQSIAPSIRSQSPVRDDPLSSRANYTSASGQRLRGLKGFWAKYGKDANGNVIPLSQMNPRAFEYTLQDGEMMNELVKFSVTVFSAENTKFLQEYDGLRKQVREYFKLVGYGNPRPRGQKHNRNASNLTESALGAGPEGAMYESDLSTRTRRKVSSILEGIATSLHRRSPQGSTTGGSDKASQSGSIIDSIVEECHSVHDGDPGSSACHQPCSAHTGRSFRKPRQELKGNLWKLSLQSSFRNSNPAFVSPYGPLQEEEDTNESLEGDQVRSDPLPLPHDKTPVERRHLCKSSYGGQTHSEMGTSNMDDANESKHSSGDNESDKSSSSWYGRGNTGSALNYQDVTQSDISSYQDTTSDGIQYPSEYYSDSYSMAEIPPSAEIGDVIIHDPLRETFDGACPIHMPLERPLTLSESQEFAPCSKNTARSSRSSRRYTSYSAECPPIGSLDRAREAMTPIAQQKQPSRFAMGQKSPFHSPSSSVSATFTPRLPSQPQMHGANTFRSHPPSFRRSISARSIMTMLTTEELAQLNAARAGTSNPTSMPLSQPQCELPPPHTQVDGEPEKESRRQQFQSSDMSSVHSHHSSLYARPPPTNSRYRPATTSQTAGQAAFPTPNQRTPIPRALLSAYWEISRTFILPNATLELNLDEEHVEYIKRLFKNNECYLEMYEPIVREVQELVYSNVWPRFVQSIQRQPQGFSEKFMRTWHGLFGKSSRSRGDEEMCTGHATASTRGLAGWRHSGRRQQQHHLGSTSRDRLQQQPAESMLMERGFAKATSSVSPSPAPPAPPPPQSSSIHGFLGGAGDRSTRGCEKGEDMEMDVGHFGVMQELDFTVLQRIVVHPK
ncbi:hypothetical protein BGX34_001340 [Mortierella sp. NVP85]|nr:hypothetical protein BGX34_001340 [Mortierella sp. NVP85]